mmetsp:Transcript_5292/g.8184  ORF Transcript_5292/g.8184 Transcript_5292/m.8184 type:complete len:171 (+) Transcript_5292:347-859(+)
MLKDDWSIEQLNNYNTINPNEIFPPMSETKIYLIDYMQINVTTDSGDTESPSVANGGDTGEPDPPKRDQTVERPQGCPVDVPLSSACTNPYDKLCYENSCGADCNGKYGVGNYCYCDSQGYECACEAKDIVVEGQVYSLCTDHNGYDCSGSPVDGEANWCKDPSNPFYIS